MQILQAYIFCILQYFPTKLGNFTHFKMLFRAVVIDLVFLCPDKDLVKKGNFLLVTYLFTHPKCLLIYVVLCSSDIPVGKHIGIPGIIIFFSSLCQRLRFLFFLSAEPYTQNNFFLKFLVFIIALLSLPP